MKENVKFSPSRIIRLEKGRHSDPAIPGLYLTVSQAGRKVWLFRRRIPRTERTVELKFGAFPAKSIAEARRWAASLNEAIEQGVDPREEARVEKARMMSVSEAHAIYIIAMRRGDRKTLKPRTLYDKEVIFTRDIEPRLGKKTLGELTECECWDGLADEHRDRHYLLVDGVDGHAHYVDIGAGGSVEPLPDGTTIRVVPVEVQMRDIDRTIAEVAAANDGRYSVDLHLRHDSSTTQSFAETHVRRLEAMRRARMDVARDPDGTWSISGDHLVEAERFEQWRLRDRPVAVEILSSEPVERLAGIEGATWLDRELAVPSGIHARDAGFGREVRAALDARRQWLIEQDLTEDKGQGFRLRHNALAMLQRRELLRVAAGLSEQLRKEFVEAKLGDRVEGRVSRRIDMASGRFALIEKSREFTLVPWWPVLEKQIGKQTSGILREGGINWTFGRGRAGPEIS